MLLSIAVPLAIVSLASSVNAYDFEATGLQTGAIVVKCIYAFLFIVLAGLCVPALAMARGHRLPYVPLLIAIILTIIHLIASIARDFLSSDGDPFSDISGQAFIILGALSSLFYNWSACLVFLAFCHLVKVRSDNVGRSSSGQKPLLSFIWPIAYGAVFVVLFVFATATSGLYINYLKGVYGNEFLTIREINDRGHLFNNLLYTFSAFWYASAFLLGVLAFLGNKAARQAGIDDKVLKTLLFVAFPLHVAHVVEDIIFLIVWSPSGITNSRNLETLDRANLAETILYLGLHLVTIAVLVFLALRRANFMLGGEMAGWQKGQGQYAGYPAYPMQTNYQTQPVYQAQPTYPTQTGYPMQTQYVDNSNTHLNPQQ